MRILQIVKGNKGLTLIETLAVLVITAIILTLLTSIMVNTSKERERQKEEASYTNDARLILKSITKDIRKSIYATVEDDTKLILTTPNSSKIIYSFPGDSKLYKEDNIEKPIAENLGCVQFKETTETAENANTLTSIEIFISTNPEVTQCLSDNKYIQATTIQLRNE